MARFEDYLSPEILQKLRNEQKSYPEYQGKEDLPIESTISPIDFITPGMVTAPAKMVVQGAEAVLSKSTPKLASKMLTDETGSMLPSVGGALPKTQRFADDVLGEGTSKYSFPEDSISDAILADKTKVPSNLLKNLAYGAGGIGGFTAGYLTDLSDGKEEINLPKPQGMGPLSNPVDYKPSINNPSVDQKTSEVSSIRSSQPTSVESEQPTVSRSPAEEGFTENTVENLKNIQAAAQQRKAIANMGSAANLILSGALAKSYKTKAPDMSAADKLWDTQRKGAEDLVKDFEARGEKEKNDPDSAASVNARNMLSDMFKQSGMKINVPNNLSQAELEKQFPQYAAMVRSKENRDARSLEAKLRREEMSSKKDEKVEEKLKDQQSKKSESLNEVENRRRNIEDNLSDLERMIEERGTFEVLGAHNANLDRKVDQIATDMAKLMDPKSVARPSEVELVKKGLVESGFKNKNKTAVQILNEFRKELNKRADTAYKIRGIENPGSESERLTQQPTENIAKKLTGKEIITGKNGKKYIVDHETKEVKEVK